MPAHAYNSNNNNNNNNGKSVFPNCIDRFGHKKRQTKVKQTQKNQGKKMKKGNNSTYHEPLSEEWIGRRP